MSSVVSEKQFYGFVLERSISGEKYWKISILTREHGAVLCFVRIAGKNKTTVVPDLFDEAEILLEKTKNGAENEIRFAKEYRLVKRNSGIAKSYAALAAASKFVAILAKNSFAPDAAGTLFSLCQNSLQAFAEKPNPAACYLKTLWKIAKNGGYPVKEDWLENSNFEDRNEIVETLKTPLEEVKIVPQKIERFARSLEFWLEREQQFLIS